MDSRLFSKYIDVKASPVIGALEQNMNIGMFDWATVYPLIGIHTYSMVFAFNYVDVASVMVLDL